MWKQGLCLGLGLSLFVFIVSQKLILVSQTMILISHVLQGNLRLWCPMTCLKFNQKQHCLWTLLLTFLLGFEKSSQWLELLRCCKFYTLKQRWHIGLILWCPKFYDYWCGASSFINITLVVQLDGDEGGIFIPANIIR